MWSFRFWTNNVHPNHFGPVRLASLFLIGLAAQGCTRHRATMVEVTDVVNSSAPALQLKSRPGQTLKHEQSVQSDVLRTEKFKHYDHGIEVIGSGLYYHEDSDGIEVKSHLVRLDLDTDPTLSSEEAVSRALAVEPGSTVRGQPILKIIPPLADYPARLIYVVELESHGRVWIDAHSSEHVATLSAGDELNPDSLTPVRTGAFGGEPIASCQSVDSTGSPLRFHIDQCPVFRSSGLPADPSAVRAEENARKFLDYFRDVHRRESYDGRGSAIVSLVHAGRRYSNAVWYKSGHFVVYGDGDGTIFRDFTYGLDVAAHELTHGVIQTSAGILSLGEPGALNESLADFFGKMVENRGDWTVGRGLWIGMDSAGFRDLKDPGRLTGEFMDSANEIQTRPFPSTRAQVAPVVLPCTAKNDFCAVHYNTTVPGHAWYLIHQKLGKEKAEALVYLALTQFMTEFSDFDDAAQATLLACAKLYLASDCAEVRDAFLSTGMLTQTSSRPFD